MIAFWLAQTVQLGKPFKRILTELTVDRVALRLIVGGKTYLLSRSAHFAGALHFKTLLIALVITYLLDDFDCSIFNIA